MNHITLVIEQLLLDGVDNAPANGQRLGEMIALELHRLLEQQGLPPGFITGDIRQMSAPDLRLPRNVSDRQMAQGAASALYRALGNREATHDQPAPGAGKTAGLQEIGRSGHERR
jgi:hypothetical protein